MRFLFVPVIVAGVVWLVRNLRSRPTAGRQGDEQATDASGADIEARGTAPTGSPSSAADATEGSTGNGAAEHAGSPGHQVG
ncbi:MAG TPA: hypothetical protein VF743_12540 [Acidimicrobiales bacterium]